MAQLVLEGALQGATKRSRRIAYPVRTGTLLFAPFDDSGSR
jgi:hypothetical protein